MVNLVNLRGHEGAKGAKGVTKGSSRGSGVALFNGEEEMAKSAQTVYAPEDVKAFVRTRRTR